MILPEKIDEFINKYWLKEQLVNICAEYDLPKYGSKEELILQICNFIEKKPIIIQKKISVIKNTNYNISLHNIIDPNYHNDENHRMFFKNSIGTKFKYNVQFMNWMKQNCGKKTYEEAIKKWNEINEEIKTGKKFSIGKQFEYNQYTRDFFTANPDKTREECIKCWNYKKEKSGSHVYDESDLAIL